MRIVASCIVMLGLASCATAPGTGPSPRDGGSGAYSHLTVCAMGVSNAPAADRRGRVIGFQPVAYVGGASLLRAPVDACVSSGYGPRRGGASSFHKGVDLYTRSPRAVFAGGDGVVEFIGTLRGYGRTVTIRHNSGVKTRYAHLSSYGRGLREGMRVHQGETIAMTGDSGNATAVHLHYEILLHGRPVDPLHAGR